MIKAHKIRLNPTTEQASYLRQAAGVARFCFNWGLAEYNKRLDAKLPVNGRSLKKEFNAIKSDLYPWVADVTTWASQGAFDDLQAAFSRFFDQKKKGNLIPPRDWKPRKDGRPFGWPRFKSKEKTTPVSYLHNGILKFDDHFVQFDKGRVGWVNMAEPLRFDGKVMGGRLSYSGNHWWLSVQVQMDNPVVISNENIVGVDLGIKYLAVTSDGQVFDNPRPLEKALRKLRRMNRHHARMVKGSNNWFKQKRAIAGMHYKISCIRGDAAHKMTTEITREYGIIGIEDLNIRGMLKNRRISRAISDAALSEKRRQIEYKAKMSGRIVVAVSRWFPSSKKCNNCGEINSGLKLSQRQWQCACGTMNHRDGNAAMNIRDEAIKILIKNSPEYSHGEYKRLNGNSSNSLIVQESLCV
jgi:putative transposase